MTEQEVPTAQPRGPASFCIPSAAFEALLAAKATAYEICAYLVLANHTDATGRYSTASISAINRRTGANKIKGGPIDRAIRRLRTIHASRTTSVFEPRGKSGGKWVERREDLGPILIAREDWLAKNVGEVLPDGATEFRKVRYILPDFGEPLDERIWFGGNLVSGIRHFEQPLKALKHAGDVPARLLLSMYAANDMETWGGVPPVGEHRGPWRQYEPIDDAAIRLRGGARLIRAKEATAVASIRDEISGGDDEAYWRALEALLSAGLIYEVVLVVNRNAIKSKLASGAEYGAIPEDAEPYYELDCRTRHGYKPKDEEGIGGATARTAGELGRPVTAMERGFDHEGNAVVESQGAQFDGTYAAIVPQGYPAMIAGIFRLRFRVSNTKNAGVKGAWARIIQNNREAFELVQSIRVANKLLPLKAPWDAADAARAVKAEAEAADRTT